MPKLQLIRGMLAAYLHVICHPSQRTDQAWIVRRASGRQGSRSGNNKRGKLQCKHCGGAEKLGDADAAVIMLDWIGLDSNQSNQFKSMPSHHEDWTLRLRRRWLDCLGLGAAPYQAGGAWPHDRLPTLGSTKYD